MKARLASLLAAIAIVPLVGSVSPVEASIINIPISNFSFETPNVGPTPGTFTRAAPPGWTASGTSASGVVYDPAHAPDGNQYGYVFRQALWQETSAMLIDGAKYQLTLMVAADSNLSVDTTYALYSGSSFAAGTLLKGMTTTQSVAQDFKDVTLTFGPSDPGYAALIAGHAGENIIVAFTSSNGLGSSDMDEVQLLELTPEPASLGLMACGSLLMLRRRRA